MNRIYVIFIVLLIVLALCSMATAAMSSLASAANGVAIAAAASALQASQVAIVVSVSTILVISLVFLAVLWRVIGLLPQGGQPDQVHRFESRPAVRMMLPAPDEDDDVIELIELAQTWNRHHETTKR